MAINPVLNEIIFVTPPFPVDAHEKMVYGWELESFLKDNGLESLADYFSIVLKTNEELENEVATLNEELLDAKDELRELNEKVSRSIQQFNKILRGEITRVQDTLSQVLKANNKPELKELVRQADDCLVTLRNLTFTRWD